MRLHFVILIRRTVFFLAFCLIFLSISYLAIAASDTIQVQQTITGEGNGVISNGSGGGIILPIDATPPEIFDVRIYDIGLHSARISFRTDEVCLTEFYYGKSKSYNFNSPSGSPDSYESYHEFYLKDLDAGSKYYLKIIIKNQKGIGNVITDYNFYTIPEFKNIPAVGSLSAVQVGKTVELEWENPSWPVFQGVQISRQTGFPPLSPNEGEKIFFGFADKFVDISPTDKTKYYYTVFAFDTSGKFSSGATVSIKTDFSTDGGAGGENAPGGTTPGGDDILPGGASFVKDVRNLQSLPNVLEKKITLSWEYSEISIANEVEIRRDLNFPSMSPLEGDLVYSGTGTSFEDRNVKKGQMYFYTVYAKDHIGKYSSGAMIATELKESAAQSPGSDRWQDMSFVDVNSELLLLIQNGNELEVLEDSTLGVNYGVESLPENLVAVAIQLGNSFYILNYNEEDSAYRTSFVVPENPGEYSFDLVFLNAENEIFFEKNLKMKVVPRGEVYALKKEAFFSGKISFEKISCRLENLLGGENLNCMTRTVIGGAEVKIFRKNEDNVWEAWNSKEFSQENPFFTDESGRYGFYLPNGEYQIGVKKNGFKYRKVAVSVDNNILAQDVQIYLKKDIRYIVILLVIILILVVTKLKKRLLDIDKR